MNLEGHPIARVIVTALFFAGVLMTLVAIMQVLVAGEPHSCGGG